MKRYEDELEPVRMPGYQHTKRNNPLPVILAAVAVLVMVVLLVIVIRNGIHAKKEAAADTEQPAVGEEVAEAGAFGSVPLSELEAQDPQNVPNVEEVGEEVDVAALLRAQGAAETGETTAGIDVARYQGVIDWAKVAGAGIDFAMVRVGYRTMESGEICEDSTAKYNMQEAQANGIKLGAYFFSTAVTEAEAVEEADWVADYIAQYQITYPVAYNCEGFNNEENRQYPLTKTERSDIAAAFLNRIYERGYTPMFYAPKNELVADAKWDTSRLERVYKVWLSHYTTAEKSDYAGQYVMWQYTNQGTVAGIATPVDVNIAYFGYAGTTDAQDETTPDIVEADVEALMGFSDISETVTAKSETNLRDVPSQGADSTVLLTLKNGEMATRTGISKNGWSRVEYNGKTYYAVSSYLTTDLSAPAPTESTPTESAPENDGLKTKFTDCSELVTAKIEVNLRTLPSVTNPDSMVVVVLHNGENVTRTGMNTEYGWSRVDYNGQTLYCVSSYLQSVQ